MARSKRIQNGNYPIQQGLDVFEVTATIYFSVIETLSKSPFQVPTENEPRGARRNILKWNTTNDVAGVPFELDRKVILGECALAKKSKHKRATVQKISG